MVHRHLAHCDWTLAAIDDAISRGGRVDWHELREIADHDPRVRQRIIRICAAKLADPYAQRYHLWNHYAQATAS